MYILPNIPIIPNIPVILNNIQYTPTVPNMPSMPNASVRLWVQGSGLEVSGLKLARFGMTRWTLGLRRNLPEFRAKVLVGTFKVSGVRQRPRCF